MSITARPVEAKAATTKRGLMKFYLGILLMIVGICIVVGEMSAIQELYRDEESGRLLYDIMPDVRSARLIEFLGLLPIMVALVILRNSMKRFLVAILIGSVVYGSLWLLYPMVVGWLLLQLLYEFGRDIIHLLGTYSTIYSQQVGAVVFIGIVAIIADAVATRMKGRGNRNQQPTVPSA